MKVELLAPAGNLEKLKIAISYGADAVYIGGEKFGLREYADNFSLQEMREGVSFAHERGKKVYLTMNIIPHNSDLAGMDSYIKEVAKVGVDAVLVSDPGVFSIVKENAPNMEIHLSTQANNTNYKSANFWHSMGVKRVVLARELSFEEIKEIRDNTKEDLELEMFVHGAMCISYSGRCLLSNYMASRDSNKGQCAHPCRWKYYLMEEKRPGEYMPVFEDEKGTYIYNSKDLCLIERIPEIIKAKVSSLKIEGRMKSAFYVATVVGAYRKAIDAYYKDPENYIVDKSLVEEVSRASHRAYTTGFFDRKPDGNEQIYNTSTYIRDYEFLGMALEYDEFTHIAKVEQRNRFMLGDSIEVMNPDGTKFCQEIKEMWDENMESIDVAPHPQMIVYIKMDKKVSRYSMLEKKA
ncbi:MAG: U32 family peptidase [Clostridiales bacterium]|nr:U32 family peptidase [Clostridiales bacterium]